MSKTAQETRLSGRIRLFGRLQIEVGDQIFQKFGTKNSALILLKLAMQPDRPVHRDELSEMLWPEDFLDVTRVRLRQELARLRKVFPGDAEFVVSDRSNVSLVRPGIATDLEQYTSLVRELPASGPERLEALEALAMLYQGPFGEGFSEVWVVRERDRWMRLHAKTLGHLALARAQAGRLDESQSDLIEARRLGLEEVEIAALEKMMQKKGGRVETLAPKRSSVTFPPLPVVLDHCFGRDSELARLEALLTPDQPNSARLVNLTGLGGIGKTRLAVEVCHRLVKDFEDRVAFVSLGEADRFATLSDVVLNKLQWSDWESGVADGPVLLVLDEFDGFVDRWPLELRRTLEAYPNLVILVTSRQAVRIAGEREILVEPFATPQLPGPDHEIATLPGVALFLDRARSVDPHFPDDAQTLRNVVTLVQQLDGIPLAIQLAATRANVLTPRQMVDQLDSRFQFLISKKREGADRHRTMLETLRWSLVDLDEHVLKTFFTLSIFRGGASAVLAAGLFESDQWTDHVEQLRDRSLVLFEESSGEMRVRLLETVRRFAREEMGEEAWQVLRHRHCAWMVEWSKLAEPQELRAEADNLRKALEFARDTSAVDQTQLETVLEEIS